MNVKKVTQKDRYGNQTTIEYESGEKPIDTTRLMEKSMEMMQDFSPPPPVGGEEFVPGNPMTHPGEPRGQDTVPAWLTPGEFVVNAEAMSIPENAAAVEAINDQGRAMQNGGAVYRGMGDWIARGQNAMYDAAGKAAQEDPRAAAEFMAGMPDKYDQMMQLMPYLGAVLGFKDGGEVPMPIAPPWSRTPEGLSDLLHEREGWRDEIYLDSLGKPTVGAGHLIEDAVWDKNDPRIGTTPYTTDELNVMFDEDMAKAQNEAVNNVGRDVWVNLSPEKQKVLSSMAFQLGGAGQRKFKKLLAAVKAGDDREVAKQALTGSSGGKSKWLKQTPKRAMDLAEVFDPDIAAQYRAAGGRIMDDGEVMYRNFGGTVYRAGGGDIPWWGHLLGDKGKEAAGLVPPSVPQAIIDDTAMQGEPEVVYPPETQHPMGAAVPQSVSFGGEDITAVDSGQAAATPPDIGMSTAPIHERGTFSPAGTGFSGAELPDVPPAVEPTPERPWWAGENWDEANIGMRMMPGGAGAFGIQNEADGVTDPEYMEYQRRAYANGQIPDDYETYKQERAIDGATGQSAIDRFTAPGLGAESQEKEIDAQQAAIETIEAGGDADDAQAAADVARGEATTSKNKPTDEEAISTLEGILQDNDVGSGPGTEQKGPEGNATQIEETAKKDPAAVGKAESMLGGLFGDLFDSKELKRMAIMYTGSRLLGYSHGGSLQWAAKNYVNRVDTKMASREQTAKEFAKTGKYDAASVEAFRKTGDYSQLQPLGTPRVATGEFKSFYKSGKQVRAQKYKVGDNSIWVGANGQPIDQTYNDKDPKVATREYMSHTTDQLKSLRGQFDQFGEGDNISYKTDINPATDSGKIAEWAYANNIPPEQLTGLVESAYHEAINDNRQDKSRVRSLVPYLNNLVVRQSTSNPDAFLAKKQGDDGTPPQYIDGQKMAALNQGAALLMKSKGKSGDDYDLTNMFYNAVLTDWNKLSDSERKQWNAKANDDLNGFYLYATSIVNSKLGG